MKIYQPEDNQAMDEMRESIIRFSKGTIVDVCTGTGIQAFIAKITHPKSKVIAVDLYKDAVDEVKYNAKNNKLDIQAQQGDLLKGLKNYDTVLAYPPCLTEEEYLGIKQPRPPKEACVSGNPLKLLKEIINQASGSINPQGRLILWVRPEHNYYQELIKYAGAFGFKTICEETWVIVFEQYEKPDELLAQHLSKRVIDTTSNNKSN